MLELTELRSYIKKHFDFLLTEFDFKGPHEWNWAHEQEFTYTNKNFYVNIGYDGGFFVTIGKLTKDIPEFSEGKKTLKEVSHKDRESWNIVELFSKKEKSVYENLNDSPKQLSFISDKIKANSEILQGDWKKFSFRYKLLKKFGLLKKQ